MVVFLSDEGPKLETLGYTILIGSTPTFLYFDLYLYSAYAAHYVDFLKGLRGTSVYKPRVKIKEQRLSLWAIRVDKESLYLSVMRSQIAIIIN